MPDLDRARRIGLWTGLVLLAVSSAAAFLTPDEFFRSYLLGYLFWTGLALGCFGVVMLHHLVGGRWGFAIRRVLESGTRTLPLMALPGGKPRKPPPLQAATTHCPRTPG